MEYFGSKEASKEREIKKARRSKTVSDSRACVEFKGLPLSLVNEPSQASSVLGLGWVPALLVSLRKACSASTSVTS